MYYVKAWLRSAAQVMFQRSALCGVLFVAGIVAGAIHSGSTAPMWGAVVGLTTALITARILGYAKSEIADGLWGFNGILVGCALMTFLAPTLYGWCAVVLCSAMTTWVKRGLDRVGAPLGVGSLTFPFVLCTWIFLASSRMLAALDPVALAHPMLPESFLHIATHLPNHISVGELVVWTLRGISQIFLIDSWLTGLLFVVGLAVASPMAALWAVVGSAVGTCGALLLGAPATAIAHGMYGFSPALTALALGVALLPRSPRGALWALVGTVGTVFVQASMNVLLAPVGLPTLTAPFCLTTWLFMLPIFKNQQH